jgi:hypothetical protein
MLAMSKLLCLCEPLWASNCIASNIALHAVPGHGFKPAKADRKVTFSNQVSYQENYPSQVWHNQWSLCPTPDLASSIRVPYKIILGSTYKRCLSNQIAYTKPLT